MKKLIDLMKKNFLLAIAIGAFVGLFASYATYEGMTRTAGPKFCASCHEMAPMRASYDQDVHGGAGKSGIRVNCVECHMPHDNLFNYIYTKAMHGAKEVVIHFAGNSENIDWKEFRKDRQHFVYDEGCKNCHTNFTTNQKFSAKARQMHRHYNKLKGSEKELGCASCHAEVGHFGLNNMLSIYKPEYPLYEKGSAKERAKINARLYGTEAKEETKVANSEEKKVAAK